MIPGGVFREDTARSSSAIPAATLGALRGKRILVTGATGMVGSCVVDMILLLNAEQGLGTELYLGGRNRERMAARFPDGGFSYIPYDTMEEFLPSTAFDLVVHCAGNADPASFATHPVETMTAGIRGLESVLRVCRESVSCRLLYVSSGEVYGLGPRGSAFREDGYGHIDILNSRACYPSAKRACETLCASYLAEYGVDFVVARPCHVYGPQAAERDCRAAASFARDAAAGRDVVMLSTGTQLRSWIYGPDCAAALLTVLASGRIGLAYNVASGRSVATVGGLARIFARAGGVSVVRAEAEDPGRLAENPMNSSVLDTGRLGALGFKAAFGLDEGVGRTVEILRGLRGRNA